MGKMGRTRSLLALLCSSSAVFSPAYGDGNGACPVLEGSYEATLDSLAGGNAVGKVAVHRKLDADGGKEYLAVGGYAIGLNDGADCDACTSGNCCGFHIHSGDSCADNVAQGGHLLNADGSSDPWSDIKIGTSQVDGTEQIFSRVVEVNENYPAIEGKAFIVHDESGNRVACGLLQRITTTNYEANSIAPIRGTSSSESITGSVEVRAGTFAVLTCTSLSGYPAGSDCSSTCGAHVHAGTACTDSSAQGIHYPDDPKDMVVLPTQPRRDPWANDIMTANSMTGTDDMGWGVSVVGSDYVDVDGKAFVVHDQANNARAACGILASSDGGSSTSGAAWPVQWDPVVMAHFVSRGVWTYTWTIWFPSCHIVPFTPLSLTSRAALMSITAQGHTCCRQYTIPAKCPIQPQVLPSDFILLKPTCVCQGLSSSLRCR